MLGCTVLKLDVEVGGDSYKTPIDFEVSRSKVKVTVIFIIKACLTNSDFYHKKLVQPITRERLVV